MPHDVRGRPFLLRLAGLALLLATGPLWSGVSVSASPLRRTAVVRAVEAARPAVVNIHGRKTVPADVDVAGGGESFRQVNGMGTGVFVDERGYILTNYHVVDGVARILVTLADGRTLTATLIARDPKMDLALLKVSLDEDAPVIRVGASSDLMLGEPVIAVGNAYGYEHTVTRGIISALHRHVQITDSLEYDNLIQTDASINPGNSGGPLLNIDGEMIGINVAVRVGAQGIGFAIPVDEAMEAAARLLNVRSLRRLTHGVVGRSERRGDEIRFVVQAVEAGSAAERAGLRPGDVIVDVGGRKVARALDLERALLDAQPGEPIAWTFVRDGGPPEEALVALERVGPAPSPVEQQAWELLGVRLAPMSEALFRRFNTPYSGGLRVVEVRPGSPAQRQGIRPGDVLVGMLKWETVSLDNVAYILNSEQFRTAREVKFYIVRNGETLYGRLEVRVAAGP